MSTIVMCSYVVIVRVSLVWILMTDVLSRVLLSDFIFLSVDNILVCVCEFLDIPVIPDLEDVQEEDMMTQIAAPPRLLYFLYYSPLVVLILSQGSLPASPQTINTHDYNINSKNRLLWERVILINLWPPTNWRCFPDQTCWFLKRRESQYLKKNLSFYFYFSFIFVLRSACAVIPNAFSWFNLCMWLPLVINGVQLLFHFVIFLFFFCSQCSSKQGSDLQRTGQLLPETICTL